MKIRMNAVNLFKFQFLQCNNHLNRFSVTFVFDFFLLSHPVMCITFPFLSSSLSPPQWELSTFLAVSRVWVEIPEELQVWPDGKNRGIWENPHTAAVYNRGSGSQQHFTLQTSTQEGLWAYSNSHFFIRGISGVVIHQLRNGLLTKNLRSHYSCCVHSLLASAWR